MMTLTWRLALSLILTLTVAGCAGSPPRPQQTGKALGTTSVKVFPINPGDKLDF